MPQYGENMSNLFSLQVGNGQNNKVYRCYKPSVRIWPLGYLNALFQIVQSLCVTSLQRPMQV